MMLIAGLRTCAHAPENKYIHFRLLLTHALAAGQYEPTCMLISTPVPLFNMCMGCRSEHRPMLFGSACISDRDAAGNAAHNSTSAAEAQHISAGFPLAGWLAGCGILQAAHTEIIHDVWISICAGLHGLQLRLWRAWLSQRVALQLEWRVQRCADYYVSVQVFFRMLGWLVIHELTARD
jgi:hypothetical protein